MEHKELTDGTTKDGTGERGAGLTGPARALAETVGRGRARESAGARRARLLGKRRVHAGYVAVLTLGLVGLVVYDGARREGTGAAAIGIDWPAVTTTAPASRATSRPVRLRVATFNVASCTGADGKQDPERTARAIRAAGADVVALHEVRGGIRVKDGAEWTQAFQLGELTDMGSAWVPTERRWWHEDFGNGLLFRPELSGRVVGALRVPLPQTQERGHRNVAVTRVRLGDEVVTVLSTHVDRRVDQEAQLRFLVELFEAVEGPAVLMGDLNVTRENAYLKRIEAAGGVEATVSVATAGQIELIYVRGLRVVEAGRVEIGASDHPLVWAEVEGP